MTGHRITLKAEKINDQVLRKINPEAARLAVIEYLKTNKGNISEAARVFVILYQKKGIAYELFFSAKHISVQNWLNTIGAYSEHGDRPLCGLIGDFRIAGVFG